MSTATPPPSVAINKVTAIIKYLNHNQETNRKNIPYLPEYKRSYFINSLYEVREVTL
jgi:hypothetical protein